MKIYEQNLFMHETPTQTSFHRKPLTLAPIQQIICMILLDLRVGHLCAWA